MMDATLRNIIYFCPTVNGPVGGVKVILRHSECIHNLAYAEVDSAVLYPADIDFVYLYHKHSAIVRKDMNFNKNEDLIIIPEIYAFLFGRELRLMGYRYGIFVQGGYLLFENAEHESLDELKRIYNQATVIISISDDTTILIQRAFSVESSKIFKIQYSIDEEIFYPADNEKENIISFMPRRLPAHSDYLLKLLHFHGLGDWELVSIKNMNEDQVAKVLRRSKIFLSFSSLEGLPLPPLEAAICGNHVIGYTGEGGKEYFNGELFTEVASGDINNFFCAVINSMKKYNKIKNGVLSSDAAKLLAGKLNERFSKRSELHHVKNFIEFAKLQFEMYDSRRQTD